MEYLYYTTVWTLHWTVVCGGVRCGPGGATVDLRWARAERRKKEEEENNRAALTILFCTDATQQIRGRLWTVDDPSVPERSQSHGSTLTHCCFFSTHVGVIDRPVVNVRGDKLLLNVLKLRGAEQMSRKFCDCLLTEWTLHLNTHTHTRCHVTSVWPSFSLEMQTLSRTAPSLTFPFVWLNVCWRWLKKKLYNWQKKYKYKYLNCNQQ